MAERKERVVHEDTRTAEEMDAFFNDPNPYSIEKLPKLPGMVLQWHRSMSGGQNDTQNIMKSMQLGWRPVLLETLNQAAQGDKPYLTTTKFNDVEGIVGTHDLVLMAIPEAFFERYQASLQRRVDMQLQSQVGAFETALADKIPGKYVSPVHKRAIVDDD